LKVIVYLQVLSGVFTAGIWIGIGSSPFLARHFHAAVEVFFSKTDDRLHFMPHAPMRSFGHSHGGEKQKK
jgi:hypothetical protein